MVFNATFNTTHTVTATVTPVSFVAYHLIDLNIIFLL